MFWINISDNLPPIMVCMKCHHALVKWRMGDGWWRERLTVVGWQTLQLCSACVISIVSHHHVCFTLMSYTVVWFGNVISVICCCLCHSGRSAQESITVLLCVNDEGSTRQVSTVVPKSLQSLLKT